MTETQIESAALVVSQAKVRAESAEEATRAAAATRDNLVARLGDLEKQHKTLVEAARAKGADQSGLALKLAVVDADIADLKPLVDEAEAAFRQTETILASARQEIVTAEQHLQVAADIDLQGRLEARATELATLLEKAIGELREVWKRRNARQSWTASHHLCFELERLRLGAQPFLSTQK